METISNMNKLVEICHAYATKQGFWDKDKEFTTRTRDFDKFMETKPAERINAEDYVISRKLLLTISELTEAMEAMRKGKWAINHINHTVNPFVVNETRDFEALIKDTFEDEIADTFIRLFDLCGYLKIDIVRHIQLKMSYNETRPRMHNKRF